MNVEITAQEAKAFIEKNRKNSLLVILDVRTPEEFAEQHLPGALNIDIYDADFPEKIAALDRSKTYLVHCKTGGRSAAAVELMRGMGFAHISNVVGWMFD